MSNSLMLDVTGVTESVLLQLRAMPDETVAIALDCRLRTLENIWKRTFIERGLILLEVEQRLLWKCLEDPETRQPYTSFERWILTAAPQSRSDAYAALRAVKELRDIPRERLEAIPRCNVAVLQALSTAVRNQPEVLKAAKDLPEREFIRQIQKDYPDQRIEERRLLHLSPVSGDKPIIDKAFRLVMEREGLTSREQVLLYWAINSIQEYEEADAQRSVTG